MESLDFALALQPSNLDIFPLSVLPGTRLHETAAALSLTAEPEPPYTVIRQPGFSGADMEKAAKMILAADLFYNQGSAVHWLFMVTETLEMKGSDLLARFSRWLSAIPNPEKEDKARITDMQCSFLEGLFMEGHAGHLFPVIRDLVTYHACVERSLYAGPLKAQDRPPSSAAQAVFARSPGTFTLTLGYALDDLLQVGEVNLEEFLAIYKPERTDLVVYNAAGEIKSVILDPPWHAILMAFDGITPLHRVSGVAGVNKTDLAEFLDFAIAETIIVRLKG
jgi:hypothetical protein